MAKKQFPEWAIILYRGVRAAVSAGLVSAFALQPDWSKLEESLQIVGIAFLTGFLVAFGKWLRDQLDVWFGLDEKSLVAKLMPV
jgi:hypothetical protein